MTDRRALLKAMAAITALLLPGKKLEAFYMEEVFPEYGLIGQMIATPGKRAELIAILKEGTSNMPGNMGYLIGEDQSNADAIWVVEVWETQDHRKAALALPKIKSMFKKIQTLTARSGHSHEFKPR